MIRRLPRKRTEKQNLIISAVSDYYGPSPSIADQKQIKRIALFTMGRKKGIQMDELEKSIAWCIAQNIKEEIYLRSLHQNAV